MGFSRKFQIGDKVQVIRPNDPRYKQIGKIIHYYPSYGGGKGVYNVNFESGTSNYYSNELEKIEDSSNTDTKSNKLSISELKPGMKVRIRPDLKEFISKYMYVNDAITSYSGTIHTIKKVNLNNTISLTDISYNWDINCFSEIVEEPKEEVKTSEKVELPLKEGQIVTLLDGKQYQVIKNNTSRITCSLCSLGIAKCGEDRCNIAHINSKPSCPLVIPAHYYFKLCEEQKAEDKSSKSLKISDFKEGMRVRVKENFNEIPVDDPLYISPSMKAFKGKEIIIYRIGTNHIISNNYAWLPEWLEIVDESTNSSNSVENSPVKEIGIITKVNFTLTDFKSEELEHSKFTIL